VGDITSNAGGVQVGPGHQQEMSHPSRTVRCMEHDTTLHVDCDRCVMQHTTACDDCLVSVVLQMTDEGNPAAFSRIPLSVQPMEFNEAEASAIHALAEAGLVPRLRLVPWEEDADLTPESATPPRDTGPTSDPESDPESSSGTGAASRTA